MRMLHIHRRRRWLLIGVSIAGIFATAVVVASNRLSERARLKAIELVEQRFAREVELEALTLQVLPWALASGRGLIVHQKPGLDLPPFIAIDSFKVDIDLLTLWLVRPVKIERLEIEGLEIHVPPDDEPDDENDGEDDGVEGGEPTPQFVINELRAPDTRLYVHGDNPERPLLWDIRALALTSAGTAEPMVFDATLHNAKPPGLIRSTGSFGPWQEDDLGATPVSGDYTFEGADLSVFDGILGTLSSKGRYDGVLDRLAVSGTTDTLDFALDLSGNPIRLRTEFEAVVDGTNGDTRLDSVRARLGGTGLVARGGVVHEGEIDGKTIRLDVVVADGQLEDLLTLAMKSDDPFMTGGISFEAQMLIPQGDRDVIDKLRLDGRFRIATARFADAALQEKIESLSSRSRGEPENPDPARVASNFAGDFSLDSATLRLSSLTFQVPGAEVEFEGTYGLRDEHIDLRGRIHMDATLSQTTTGFKSFLLKLVEPFFSGDRGNGSSVPIKIAGTREEPDFGLDLGGN